MNKDFFALCAFVCACALVVCVVWHILDSSIYTLVGGFVLGLCELLCACALTDNSVK